MKKFILRLFIISIIFIFVGFIFSYFHVSGNEINGVSNISSKCKVTITKNYDDVINEYDYYLNEKQIEMLKKLILKSDFIRVLPSAVYFDSNSTKYSIHIKFDIRKDDLIIDSIGNKYISILNQFNGKHLRICNPNWEKTIEKIIQLSS